MKSIALPVVFAGVMMVASLAEARPITVAGALREAAIQRILDRNAVGRGHVAVVRQNVAVVQQKVAVVHQQVAVPVAVAVPVYAPAVSVAVPSYSVAVPVGAYSGTVSVLAPSCR